MPNRAPVRIIGGGMTGLTVGYRLSQRGIPVVVHERDPYLGGLSSEGLLGDVPVERYYHCILPTDHSLLGILKELGLSDDLGWRTTRTGFFHEGRLLEMTTGADFLRFPALNLLDRMRLGWTIVYCGLNRRWQRFDREPIGRFLTRHSGARVFRSIWEPLLIAKLGVEYDRFSASFIWATIVRLLGARKAEAMAERLGFVKGRYGKVFAALRAGIIRNGGDVLVGEEVTSLRNVATPAGEGVRWQVFGTTGTFDASGVVLTVPATIAVQLLEGAHPEYTTPLKTAEYLGVVCEVLLLKRSLSPYYVLNLTDRSVPLTGVIELSNLTGVDEFGRASVIYLPRYSGQMSAIWDRTDEDIHREDIEALLKLFPGFKESEILSWQVNRARFVQPVRPIGSGDRIPSLRLGPGIAYVSTLQLHPWPVFNDEVVRYVESNIDVIAQLVSS